jgi:hypothetical protein
LIVGRNILKKHWLNLRNIMNNNYEINNGVGIFTNALSKEKCQQFIDFFESCKQKRLVLNRVDIENISSLHKDDSNVFINTVDELSFKDFPYNDSSLHESLLNCYKLYATKYSILDKLCKHTITPIYRIQKTEVGGGYHMWHCEQTSQITSNRIAAWTIYLNDVDYGGETEFLYQAMRVPATRGTLCIFPSSYTHTHRGNPPISNVKYILTSWIEFIE